MPKIPSDAPVLRAAARWADRCLRRDGSVFTEKSLWTAENVRYLVKYFVENLDEGEGSFLERLEKQLLPAPGTAKQLAAEMFWVMFLFLSSMHAGTKRRQIRQVWEWSGEPLPEASLELREALGEGVANPGPAFNTLRWREFLYFIRAMEAWKNLRVPEREARLADPWEFAKWLLAQDDTGNRQLRHILTYLLFPDHFEPVATNYQKRLIVRAYRTRFGQDPDKIDYSDRIVVDQEVLKVRDRLEDEDASRGFSFFDEDVMRDWRPETKTGQGKTHAGQNGDIDKWYAERFGEARVWLLSPGQNARHWDDFQQKGVIAIGWDELGDLRGFETRESIHEAIQDIWDEPNPVMGSLACHQFARDMQPGDHVIVKLGRSGLLGHGTIESGYRYDAARPEYRHVRQVRWTATGRWKLPKDQWVPTKTLTDFSENRDWLRFAFGLMEEGGGGPDEGNDGVDIRPEPPVNEEIPYLLDEALEDLFMSPGQFQGIIDALERKMNIVLEGPPGVGKTFIAKRVAYSLIGYKVPERVRMIQFHQSYAYEDFIQGFRPREKGGFELKNGVFFSFCHEAAIDPDKRYVFIIDEVNRGNLSKIFGELMMLIEADKRGSEYAIPLTYKPRESFHVPDNLYLIGMMNTADRSLAMVDYALRRRFRFIRLQPAFGTDQFSNFLLAAGVEEDLLNKIVDRLTDLNRTIRDDRKNLGPGFEIGHSFFCPRDEEEQLDDAWYEAIVRGEIEPLLREYWFDRPDYVDERIRDLLA